MTERPAKNTPIAAERRKYDLIEDLDRARALVRDLFAFGFHNQAEYMERQNVSQSMWYNLRMMIESWLHDYVRYYRGETGPIYLSADGRHIIRNPLYNVFRAKNCNPKSTMLHFCVLDALAEGRPLTGRQLADAAESRTHITVDESTLRKQILVPYSEKGILQTERRCNKKYYRLSEESVSLAALGEAIAFASEQEPVGVIGAFLSDRLPKGSACAFIRFKHHYLLNAMDSEILNDWFCAMRLNRKVCVTVNGRDTQTRTVTPLRILTSTQTGRQYFLGYDAEKKCLWRDRLDRIRSVEILKETSSEEGRALENALLPYMWGNSLGSVRGTTAYAEPALTRVEMVVSVSPREEYIVRRLKREKRNGTVEQIAETEWKYTAVVLDAQELIPWLRSFIGRIVSLKCTDLNAEKQPDHSGLAVEKRLWDSFRETLALYEEEE